MQHHMETRLARFAPEVRYRAFAEDELTQKVSAIRSTRERLAEEHVLATGFFATIDAAASRRWLERAFSQVASIDQPVQVVWPASRFGVDMSLGDFIEHHDGIWLPSSDDVWVVPLEPSWLLELDHEEHATLFRVRAAQAPRHQRVPEAAILGQSMSGDEVIAWGRTAEEQELLDRFFGTDCHRERPRAVLREALENRQKVRHEVYFDCFNVEVDHEAGLAVIESDFDMGRASRVCMSVEEVLALLDASK
jgi:hypothetical protein